MTISSGASSPSACRSAISTRSTPSAWKARSAICPPGMRAATSTTTALPSRTISCGNAIPSCSPSVRTARSATRSASSNASPKSFDGNEWIHPTPNPSPGGRSRSDRSSGYGSPPRVMTSPFSSSPSVNSSRIASPVGDSASAACRCRSRSSNDLSMKRPRWPPESAGLSTAGNPTVSAAGAASRRARTAANRGCGTPPSASLRRIATLCVIRCAVFVPIPGSPSASATAATTGTARSADTVSAPSTANLRATSITPSTSTKSTTSASSACWRPAASGLRSTATTRRPSCFARRIARRWWRPAPTKRTVFTRGRCYLANRNATRSQRAISQPFRRVNRIETRRPRNVPRTSASCGPP